jgi:hypothetical protein
MPLTRTSTILATAAVALGAAVPFAAADQPSTSPNGPKPPTTAPATPTTPATPAAPSQADKRKGYGVLCKGLSKKHVKGQKGTPFSQCVVALAKIDSGKTSSPRKACKDLSKKHVEGRKGTPFSQCVVAATKQREKTAAGA